MRVEHAPEHQFAAGVEKFDVHAPQFRAGSGCWQARWFPDLDGTIHPKLLLIGGIAIGFRPAITAAGNGTKHLEFKEAGP
jgi:hypothetical protein